MIPHAPEGEAYHVHKEVKRVFLEPKKLQSKGALVHFFPLLHRISRLTLNTLRTFDVLLYTHMQDRFSYAEQAAYTSLRHSRPTRCDEEPNKSRCRLDVAGVKFLFVTDQNCYGSE